MNKLDEFLLPPEILKVKLDRYDLIESIADMNEYMIANIYRLQPRFSNFLFLNEASAQWYKNTKVDFKDHSEMINFCVSDLVVQVVDGYYDELDWRGLVDE